MASPLLQVCCLSKQEMVLRLMCLALLAMTVSAKVVAKPADLTEANWTQMLEGEWLVEFYAPWCPACKALAPEWEKVAGWGNDLGFKVAAVDVTRNPGLSGRFLVMALPTIFHVKDGVFRTYTGMRGENEFVSFVDDKKYENVEPVPWWKSPSSIQMGAVGLFFKASMVIREVHTQMTEEYGLPVWGSYALFAIATIIVGMILGVIIVFLCDVILPPRPAQRPVITPQQYSAIPTEARDGDPTKNNSRTDEESDIVEDDREQEVPEADENSTVRQRTANPAPTD